MYSILHQISVWIILLPLVIGVAVLRNICFDSKLVFAIVLIGTIPQMINFYYPKSTAESISYNLYSPIEFIVYYLLFNKKVLDKKNIIVLKLTCIVCIVLSIIFLFKYNIGEKFINEWSVFNNLCYLIWISLYLYQTFEYDKGDFTSSNPFFCYTIGIFIYAACTTVVYSLWQRILNSPSGSPLTYLRSVQGIFNIVMYILFSIGLLIDNNKTKMLLGK